MSRNNKNVKQSAPIQKYCKVCHDAGKSEAEYRSHFTRESPDPKSKVVCPTLLALECRYCYKNGHTVKYCPILKDKEKQSKRYEASVQRAEVSKKAEEKPKGKSYNNVFMCLDTDSESDEEEVAKPQIEVKEEFPALAPPSLIRTQTVSTNYAAALAKAAPTKAPEVVVPVVPSQVSKPEVRPAPWASGFPKASQMKSWADWSDSDSEDDSVAVPYVAPKMNTVVIDEDW